MPALWRLRQEGWKLGAPQAHSEFESILTDVHEALSQDNTRTHIFIIFNICITSFLFCIRLYVPVGVLGCHTLIHGSQRTASESWFPLFTMLVSGPSSGHWAWPKGPYLLSHLIVWIKNKTNKHLCCNQPFPSEDSEDCLFSI